MPVRFRTQVQKVPRHVKLLLTSALLLILSYPPFDLGWLAWGALMPWLMAIERSTPRQAFWRSYGIGVLFFSGTIWWLVHVTVPGTILLVFFLALYFAAWGWLARRLLVAGRWSLVFELPLVWVILEYLRSMLLTGFGWNLLAHTQWNWIPVIQIADLTHVWGVSFLIVMVNAALYLVIRGRRFPLAMALALLGVAFGYGTHRLNALDSSAHPASAFKVAVVQGNIPQGRKWDEVFAQSIWKTYEELTLRAAQDKPDLILWPETAVPGFLEDQAVYNRLSLIARAVHTPLLVGVPVGEGDRIFNSAVLMDGEGNIRQEYRKLHLVPFGEYVPLGPWLSWLRKFILMGEFSPGHARTVFDPAPLTRHPSAPFSVLICFEDLFPDLAGRFVHQGARWLVVITNDAWFEKSSASLQHLQASVFRAVEQRVWVVRAANTGWSGFIDPAGRRLPFPRQARRFQPGIAVAEVVSP